MAVITLILNEDRHTNNILFLYNPVEKVWQLSPIFDNGLILLSDEKDYAPGKTLTILKQKVKAKRFNSSFSKQLALYTWPTSINKSKLLESIDASNIDFGRSKQVLVSQLNEPMLAHLFFEGSELND